MESDGTPKCGLYEENGARPEGFEPPTFGFEVHRSIP